MRKLLPETMRRREETKRRMEECGREWDNAMSRLDELACKTPQDPYSDELDYSMEGANDGTMQGNQMKMCKALLAIRKVACRDMRHYVPMSESDKTSILAWSNLFVSLIDSALTAPPRNCDVGTAEEQAERYHATGEVYHTLTLTNALEWSQMPYGAEEGGAK